jgi:hypothetical protein
MEQTAFLPVLSSLDSMRIEEKKESRNYPRKIMLQLLLIFLAVYSR